MKKHMMVLIAASGLLAGCTDSSVKRASQEFSQLPPAVQKVVRAKAPDAEISGVRERTRDGITVYEIQFRDKTRHPGMAVAADGTLVRFEASTAAMGRPDALEGTVKGGSTAPRPRAEISALPVNVQKAIKANAPTADVVDIRRKEENGRMFYEIEYAGANWKPTLHVTADGTILKKPDEVQTEKR